MIWTAGAVAAFLVFVVFIILAVRQETKARKVLWKFKEFEKAENRWEIRKVGNKEHLSPEASQAYTDYRQARKIGCLLGAIGWVIALMIAIGCGILNYLSTSIT